MEKNIKMKISIAILIITIIFSCWYIPHLKQDCWKSVPTCYKTECTVWGCEKIEVDIDSEQCEIKKDKCIRGTLVWED